MISNTLNDQFSSVFVKEDDKEQLSPLANRVRPDQYISDIVISEKMVIDKLAGLNMFKSMGCDQVSPYVLKKCALSFAKPLLIIFKKSLSEGCIPSAWKQANVTPIYKKGSRLLCENYRPVSLTSVPCKILEIIIRDKIIEHLATRFRPSEDVCDEPT